MKLLKNLNTDLKEWGKVFRSIWSISPARTSAILILRLFSAIFPLITIYQTKQIIDAFTNNTNDLKHLILFMSLLGISLLLTAACQLTGDYLSNQFQQMVADKFSFQVIEKAGKVAYSYYEHPDFHKSLHLAQQQALYRTSQLIPALNGAISSFISIVLLCAFFVALHSYFFLLLMAFAIPVAINKWLQAKKATDLEYKLVDKERESHYMFQLLTGFQYAKELRAFGFGESFLNHFAKIRKWIAEQKNELQNKALRKNLIAEALEILVFTAALTYLAKSTFQKEITIGFFIIYLQGIQRLQLVTTTFFQSFLQVFQLRVFFRDLFSFFQMKEMDEGVITKKGFPEILETLSIQHLSYNYPGKKQPALHDITLEAKKGQIIAIVGETGSGKSTLVKLIAGLYSAQEGDIFFNEISAKKISNEQLFKNSSIFFQDFEKYFIKVDENIHFEIGNNTGSFESVRSAAKKSGADEFIQKLALGYDTTLGNIFQSREQLSGGEWQKLALSRIFYKDAKLIILDEPSSALDAISEKTLYENISKQGANKITILVSHRLYNLKIVDCIYVMENGSIKEYGTFDELINRHGLFNSLYKNQKI